MSNLSEDDVDLSDINVQLDVVLDSKNRRRSKVKATSKPKCTKKRESSESDPTDNEDHSPFTLPSVPIVDLDEHKYGTEFREITDEMRPFRCSKCKKLEPFPLEQNLRKHAWSEHHRRIVYICETCRQCFYKRNEFRDHLSLCKSVNHYVCELCNTLYGRKSKRNVCLLIHAFETPFKCPLCRKCFTSQAHLVQHALVHRSNSYQCFSCVLSFTQEKALKQHERTHTKKELTTCGKCGKIYTRNDNLKRHYEDKHIKRLHTIKRGEVS